MKKQNRKRQNLFLLRLRQTKQFKTILILIIFFSFFGLVKSSNAVCPDPYPDGMIFCDDYEDWVWEEMLNPDTGEETGEYTWVHNKYYSTSYAEWYGSFQAHNFRSTDAYSGEYSFNKDFHRPYYHATTIGLTGLGYGNTENFNLADAMDGETQAYFKWQQKFEEDIDWSAGSQHKLLYINYQNQGDFVYVINIGGPNSFHVTVSPQTPYEATLSHYAHYDYSDSLDDDQWHTYEVYLDWTSTEVPVMYFSNGNVEPEVSDGFHGNYIQGMTSGARGYIQNIDVTSGSFAGGDAMGTFQLLSVTGEFEDGESMLNNGLGVDNFATVVHSPINSGTCWAKIDGNILSSSIGSCYIRDSDEPGDDLVKFSFPANCPPAGEKPGIANE